MEPMLPRDAEPPTEDAAELPEGETTRADGEDGASASPASPTSQPRGRPPLEDFLGYLDGSLEGDRRQQFEAYLVRNREARRRLKQLSRLDAMLADHLVIESLLSNARKARRQRGGEPESPANGTEEDESSTTLLGPIRHDERAWEPSFDETLIAAWIDGALTLEERSELARRLSDPPTAAAFYREAQAAKRVTEAMQAPQPKPDDAYGRLLLHMSQGSVAVLDAAPTLGAQRPPVETLSDEALRITLPFQAFALTLDAHLGYRGLDFTLTPGEEVAGEPPSFVLTDEAGRRLFACDPLEPGAAVPLPSLRPGVYRLTAPPSAVSLLLCINGELGTTEIHRLLGLS